MVLLSSGVWRRSMSAAHNAAPTELLRAKPQLTTGSVCRSATVMPNWRYPILFESITAACMCTSRAEGCI